MRLKDGTEPYAEWDAGDFEEEFQDGLYYNIPREYFDIRRDRIYLDSEVATQLEWHIDADLGDRYNIACSGGFIHIDGEKISVNPGFWCSYVRKSEVIQELNSSHE